MKPVILHPRAGKPAFCRDGDDFNKLLMAMTFSFADPEETEAFANSLKAVCHDYLALVLQNQITPYEIDDEEVARNIDDFRALINEANVALADVGVPLKETDGGRVEIDYEEFSKRQGTDMSTINVKRKD